jgi:hypothetical protein
MSLDWNHSKVPKELRTYNAVNSKGEVTVVMHPKMEKLIWLTMLLRMSYTGDAKKKNEVKKRIAYLREVKLLSPLWFDDAVLARDGDLWKGANKVRDDQYEYYISDEDVDTYWGLSTNNNYGDTFTKWKALVDKEVAYRKKRGMV